MLFKLLNKLFPTRCREIPHVDGGVLLRQVRVFKNVYLQQFAQPEVVDMFHLHRWSKMRSFILSGHYVEERLYADKTRAKIRHQRFTTFTMTRDVVHRVHYWSPRCWTLFIYSDDNLGWGYIDPDHNFTDWQDYIPSAKRVDSI